VDHEGSDVKFKFGSQNAHHKTVTRCTIVRSSGQRSRWPSL